MSDALITKRLHVSGITPALTANDINQRLSSFGTVKALDGFGLLDGVGEPRKFGYVTIQTTPAKLARCLNLLSGSTWKGTKLRIGEAKPDFAERIARENSSDEPPKKKSKRSHSHGVLAADMSLVTPENAGKRVAWTVTPLGRILRPMRMRPLRPLPAVTEKRAQKRVGQAEKKRKKMKDPDSRARIRTIDMTRWGSVYLKGKFLDMEVVGAVKHLPSDRVDVAAGLERAVDASSDSSSEEESAMDIPEEPTSKTEPIQVIQPTSESNIAPASIQPPNTPPGMTQASLLAEEKSHALTLLAKLFDGKADSEWVGREDLGSDVDEDEVVRKGVFEKIGGGEAADGEEEFETVPMDDGRDQEVQAEEEDPQLDSMAIDADLAQEARLAPQLHPLPSTTKQQKPQKSTKLKDLFAPREEDAGFSLLGHLDLDLELDEDILFSLPAPTPTQGDTRIHAASTTTTSSATHHPPAPPSTATYDPSLPFFFPSSTHPHNKSFAHRTQGIIPDWRDPAVSFFRTETEEVIREKWEKERGELTREWKRRWREAGKVKRRRGGTGIGEGD